MSFIRQGTCEKCGEKFYWSVGHPLGWNAWMRVKKYMHPGLLWWLSFGLLCPDCAPPMPENSGIGLVVSGS